ncbi:MAG: inositol monophosphatase family protein, partial [Actinoallomurus sp.]
MEMPRDLTRYAKVAQEAINQACTIARRRFGQALVAEVKGPRGDLVTAVDRDCEAVIIDLLHRSFPDHTIETEESGVLFEGSNTVWLVDPLDGTNNYANLLPLYGAAVTLCHRGEPLVAAIGEAHSGDVAYAIRDQGVWMNDKPFVRAPATNHQMPATALWIGYESEYDGDLSAVSSLLNTRSRRVYCTWAPTIDVFLYLRGGLDAIVVYQCSGTELLGSLLMAGEAGAEIRSADGAHVRRLADLPELTFVGDPETTLPL